MPISALSPRPPSRASAGCWSRAPWRCAMCRPSDMRAVGRQQRGTALVAGLLLLSVITLLGLAGATSAQVELRLARNEQFRENAVSAASAGIEIAISHVTASAPESVPARLFATLPGDAGS